MLAHKDLPFVGFLCNDVHRLRSVKKAKGTSNEGDESMNFDFGRIQGKKTYADDAMSTVRTAVVPGIRTVVIG